MPEGKAVVDKGMAAGVLGVGAEAARHKRLLDLAVKQEQEGKAHLAQEVEQARDGNAWCRRRPAGVLRPGGPGHRPAGEGHRQGPAAQARRRQAAPGLAQLKKNKAKGLQTLRSVQGNDGVADIARLYAILASQS
jgi:hypothetical protein